MDATSQFDRDGAARQRQLESLDRLAQRFGASLNGAFSKNVAEGKRLDGVLNAVGRTLLNTTLKVAAKPLRSGLEALIKGALSGGAARLQPSPRAVCFRAAL